MLKNLNVRSSLSKASNSALRSFARSNARVSWCMALPSSARSVFVYSTRAERKTSRTDRFGTSIAHESTTRGISVTIEHLANNDLKVALRSLVPGSDVPHRPSRQPLLHMVHSSKGPQGHPPTLGAVFPPSSSGCAPCWPSLSPRKSAALPKGRKAAILALRYLSSGVIGLLFVKMLD